MKKLISLILAVCMCLSISVMLTACGHEHTYQTEWSKDITHHWHACEGEDCTEVSDKAEHTWNDGEITTPATAEAEGVKTFTCTACGQTKTESVQLKTTVTEAEWNAAFALTNATASGFFTENGKQESVLFKIADTVYYSKNDGYVAWVIEKDGEYYMYSVSNSEGQLLNGFSIAVSTMLMSFHLPEYASFSYDEATKSYTCINTDYPKEYYKFNVYFENGFVVKFESRDNSDVVQYSFDFTNYGTTVLIYLL